MYSGMFTHRVKPAFTTKQAKKLFGLLGYQPSCPGEEEELRLNSKPVKADVLLQLACAFFTARIECQLLLSAVTTLDGSMKSELQLIQDRKDGNSLHAALDNALKMSETKSRSFKNHTTDVETSVDIYTDETLASPPSLPYIPPKESALSFSMSYSNTSPVKKEKDGKTSQVKKEKDGKTVCDQIPKLLLAQQNENEILAKVSSKSGHVCNCFQLSSSSLTGCTHDEEIHDEACPRFQNCQKQGQIMKLKGQSGATEDQPQAQEKTLKNSLRQHSCMKTPTNDYFWVCYDCNYIHDFLCQDVMKCKSQRHNGQPTGKLQLPQEKNTANPERHTCLRDDDKIDVICSSCDKYHNDLCIEKDRCQKSGHDVKFLMEPDQQGKLQLPQEDKITASPERHWCLNMVDDKYYIICSTCNKYHDYLCSEKDLCQKFGHDVKYMSEPNKLESQSLLVPLQIHDCCSSRQPNFICYTCRIVHSFICNDGLCRGHETKVLESLCTECSNQQFFTLCGYCFKQYCKNCWFKDPMQCKCGKPFLSTNV